MEIGLVLHAPIAYSETFFLNQIHALEKSGNKVTIFSKFDKIHEYNYAHEFSLPTRFVSFRDFLFVIKCIFPFFFYGLKPATRLFLLERKYGSSLIDSFKRVYFNAHILSTKIDWLHFGFATVALERELVAKALNINFSVSLRGSDISVFPIHNTDCYKRLWEFVDKVHFVSNDLYKRALALGLSNLKPKMLIQEGVELSAFPRKITAGEMSDPIKIISVGRLHWIKGYQYALEAIQVLVKNNYNIQYIIIGSGEQEEELSFKIRQMGLLKNVSLKGQFSHEMVIKALYNSDIFLQSSLYEGFSQAILEAQALGLLAITSSAGDMGDNVVHNKTGWIVELGSGDALARKIAEVIALPLEKRQEISSFARERVGKEFTFEKYRLLWIEFFNNS